MNPLGSQAAGSADASSSAALRGASVAFQQQKAKPAPAPPRKDNGALSAATTAGLLPGAGHHRTPSWQQQHQQPFVVQGTGGSFVSDAAEESRDRHGGAGAAARFAGGGAPAGGHLYSGLMPGGPSRVDSKSPSFIAATLAASRSVSPSPAGRSPMRGGYANWPSTSSEDVRLGQGVDSGSIPPTGALISMFEKARVEGPSTVGDRIMEERMREQARMAAARVQPVTVDLGGWSVETSPKARGDERHLPELTADALARLGPPARLERRVSAEIPGRISTETRDASRVAAARSKSKAQPEPPSTSTAPAGAKHTKTPSVPPKPPPEQVAAKRRSSVETSKDAFRDVSNRWAGSKSPRSAVTVVKPLAEKPQPQPQPRPQVKATAAPPETRQTPVTASPSSAEATPRKPKLKPKPAPLTPSAIISRSTPPLVSPTPIRITKPNLEPHTAERRASRVSPLSPSLPSPDPQKKDTKPKAQPPTPPQPRGGNRLHAVRPAQAERRPSATTTPKSPASRSVAGPLDRKPSLASESSSVPASSVQLPQRLSPPPPPKRSTTSTPGTPRPWALSSNARGASMDKIALNQLTNAIVAGSLASARLTPHNTGSSLPPPALPRRQKSPHLHQTLRQPASLSDDEADRQKKGHHRTKLRSGKHSHHEGSRKRWRDQIRQPERKRYEAVWASNRGLLIPQAAKASPSASTASLSNESSGYVSNIVVRDIWRRSRLPDDELAELWDLVDREGRSMLSKHEFVVGLWLIDQRLRGRKIPPKVSDSLWGSANGLSVKRPKRK